MWRYTHLMNAVYPIAAVADLIGEPARAAILVALLDGRALSAGELALLSRVSAQSASGHLSKLVDGGLLSVQNEGRHRYYKIANPEVGHALEALGAISTAPRNSLQPHPREVSALRHARTCYDHLAGRIAVELTKALESSGVIRAHGERDYELGKKGPVWFAKLGIETEPLRRSRRAFARQCLDWTERRPHIAGALGTALCSRLLALGWLARQPNTRALRITHLGERELQTRFGVTTCMSK
jgi:DNA-binding transcriptional ArsR family regulator